MKATEVFPSNYLKKEDVSKPLSLIIDSVAMEDVSVDDGKEKKAVMHFKGDSKPLIINRGNWGILEEAYGDDSDDWTGKPVEVFVDPSVMFAGKRVGGIRVRIPSGPAQPETWTLDEALAAASAAGLTKETVLSNLRSMNITAWNGAKCTPLVRKMIEEGETIPF